MAISQDELDRIKARLSADLVLLKAQIWKDVYMKSLESGGNHYKSHFHADVGAEDFSKSFHKDLNE